MKLAPTSQTLADLALQLREAIADYAPNTDFSIEVTSDSVDPYQDGLGVAGCFGAVPVGVLAGEIQDLVHASAAKV